MVPYRYEELSHTADLALRVWGENFLDMLCHAAQGMYHLMGTSFDRKTSSDEAFTITNGSDEEILVDFLNELLFLCDARRRMLDKFQFSDTGDGLQVRAVSHSLDYIHRSIKAVTFHDLKVEQSSTGCETIITFDV